jgi:hypothetical protein
MKFAYFISSSKLESSLPIVISPGQSFKAFLRKLKPSVIFPTIRLAKPILRLMMVKVNSTVLHEMLYDNQQTCSFP